MLHAHRSTAWRRQRGALPTLRAYPVARMNARIGWEQEVALARSVEVKDLVVLDSRPGERTTGARGLALST